MTAKNRSEQMFVLQTPNDVYLILTCVKAGNEWGMAEGVTHSL